MRLRCVKLVGRIREQLVSDSWHTSSDYMQHAAVQSFVERSRLIG